MEPDKHVAINYNVWKATDAGDVKQPMTIPKGLYS